MKGGIRIRLPMEAVITLESLYREGMTTNKRTDLVQKAVETTGLDRAKVKNWIQNRRGKARRRDPNYAKRKTSVPANFTTSTAVNPLSLGSNPRLYKRPRSSSIGSLNLHHHHPQFTSLKLNKAEKKQDRKDIAEKTWADVSQALTALSYHGYHFVCSVYSSEDNFMAVRSAGYGARFLSTIQGDKGVENLWKAVEVLEKSKKRAAKLVDDVRHTGNNMPEATNASRRSESESDSGNDHEGYDSEDYEEDSDETNEESNEMNPSALSPGYDHRANPRQQGTQSARASDIKRRSSASSTSAAMTLAALADAAFATSSVERRVVNTKEPPGSPNDRPKNKTDHPAASTNPDRFGSKSQEESNSKKLPSPNEIVSVTYINGEPVSKPSDQSRTLASPATRPTPAWINVDNVLLSKQDTKHSFSIALKQSEISSLGQTGSDGVHAHPYAERNRMTEDNILPLPDIQSHNDAQMKHGRFGGMAP